MKVSAQQFGGLSDSQRLFLRRYGPIFAVYGFIVILILIGATQSERFLTVRNLTNVARQAAFLGIVALGQMLVILTAGIDLSVGSLGEVVDISYAAIVMNGEEANHGAAIAAALGLGLVRWFDSRLPWSMKMKLAPFIVTLASLGILRGVSLSISTSPVGSASRPFIMFYVQKLGPIPVIALMFVALLMLDGAAVCVTRLSANISMPSAATCRSGASLRRACQADTLWRIRHLQHQRVDYWACSGCRAWVLATRQSATGLNCRRSRR